MLLINQPRCVDGARNFVNLAVNFEDLFDDNNYDEHQGEESVDSRQAAHSPPVSLKPRVTVKQQVQHELSTTIATLEPH